LIVLLGPDNTGKTTLASQLISSTRGLTYKHFTKDSGYSDYLPGLCSLEFSHAVLDRFAICEYPYARVMERQFKFSMKEFQNLVLLMLIQNPLVILCTHVPEHYNDTYLPYEKWGECLNLYIEFLDNNHIPYYKYDYAYPSINIEEMKVIDTLNIHSIAWWMPHWISGYGAIGARLPKVLVVAERIGPNNIHNLPFETGPTGYMLTDLIEKLHIPYNDITITNLVKAPRHDSRAPNDDDLILFEEELVNLQPQGVIFMGKVSYDAGKVVTKKLGIKSAHIEHLGALNHRGITDISAYSIKFGEKWFELTGKDMFANKAQVAIVQKIII